MSHFTVTFLNKDYSIPSDVMTYFHLTKVVDEITNSLISSFCQQVAVDFCNLEKSNFMLDEINNQALKFIALLSEEGISDATLDDYLCDNEGYSLFRSKMDDAFQQIISIRQEKLSFYKAGLQEAVQKREASVTGLEFQIISDSFIDHMVYALMNDSELGKQEQAAMNVYNQEIAELENAAKSYDEQERNYISKDVLPAMRTIFTRLSYGLLDKHVSILIDAEKFDESALSFVDIKRSNDLLKNLEVATNKQPVIEHAFSVCPYNADVFMSAMDFGILDYTSFQTAKLFGHEKKLLSALKENLLDSPNSNAIHFDYNRLKLLALYTDTPLKDITAYAADFVIKSYSEIATLLKNPNRCEAFFNEVSEDEITRDDHISKDKSDLIINSVGFTNLWDKLIHDCGHDDLLDRLLILFPNQKNLSSKAEIDSYLKTELYEILEKIRTELSTKIVEKEKAKLAYERTLKARIKKFWQKYDLLIYVSIVALGVIIWIITGK